MGRGAWIALLLDLLIELIRLLLGWIKQGRPDRGEPPDHL